MLLAAVAGWGAFVILLFVYTGNPRVVTVTKTEIRERVTVKTEWKLKLVAGPSAVTTALPDGTITVTGPASFESVGESVADTSRDIKTTVTTRPADREWGLAVGASLPIARLGETPHPWVAVSRRIIGGFWLDVFATSGEGWRVPMAGLALRVEI